MQDMVSNLGLLICVTILTAAAGSLDYEREDAAAFASWDVDYLKYDNCYHMGRFGTPQISYNRFDAMWKAINSTGRPMLYSLCNWGEDYPHTVRSSVQFRTIQFPPTFCSILFLFSLNFSVVASLNFQHLSKSPFCPLFTLSYLHHEIKLTIL